MTTATTAPITARRIPTGWLYEQAGEVARKSRIGGEAYAYAVTVYGWASSFHGSLKSARAEKAKRDRYTASCAEHVAKSGTLEGYIAASLKTKQHASNRAYWLANGGEAKLAEAEASHLKWCAQNWQRLQEDAQRVVEIAPITVVG